MKKNIVLPMILLLGLGLTLGACNQTDTPSKPVDPPAEKKEPVFLTSLPLPSEMTAEVENKGMVETFTYKTKIYDINGVGTGEVEKKADVYLPYDFSFTKKYNVLYLMHGGGETYTYWLTEQKNTVKMLDNIFDKKIANECIVVAPTFYTSSSGMDSSATDVFQYELRNDLIPALEADYPTYCKGDVTPENLIKTREHRGFAGLSMGSMTSIRSALLGCLDICAYISSMSGGYDASDSTGEQGYALIHDALTGKFKDYPVCYWLNQNGTSDMALTPHENLKNLVLERMSNVFKEDENFAWIKFQGGAHDYRSWIVGLYNTLQAFF